MHVHSNNIIKRARSDKKPIWGDVSFRESAKCTQFHNFHSYLSTFVYGYIYYVTHRMSNGRGKVPFYKFIQIAAIKGQVLELFCI